VAAAVREQAKSEITRSEVARRMAAQTTPAAVQTLDPA